LSGWNDDGGAVTWNAGQYAQRLAVGTGNFSDNNIDNLVQGNTYRVAFTIADVVGVMSASLGDTVPTVIPPVVGQVHIVTTVVCGVENFNLRFRNVDGTFSKIDNVSVRAVL